MIDDVDFFDRKMSYSRTVAIIMFCLYLLGSFYSSGGWPPIYQYPMAVLAAVAGAAVVYLSGLMAETVQDWLGE